MSRAWKRLGGRSAGAVVAIFLLAFAIRGVVGAELLSRGPANFVLASDDGDAYDAAAQWQAFGTPVALTPRLGGKWGSATSLMDRWPQGYWLFLAAQYVVFGSAYLSTLVLQALLGAGGALAGYALAGAVLSRRAALLAGLALALSSTAVYLGSALYAESLYMPLVLAGLALAAHGVSARRFGPGMVWWSLLAGLVFGLAEATRPLALPIVVAVLVWRVWPLGTSGARESVKCALALIAGFMFAIAPFVAHDLAVLGRITTFTVGAAEALGDPSAPGTRLLERLDLLFAHGGWGPLGEPLVSLLGGATAPVRAVEALLGVAGLVWLVRPGAQTQRVGWLMLLASLAVLLPPLFIGLPLVRYRAVADPLMIVAMGAVLEAAWRMIHHPGLSLRPAPSAA